MPSGESERWHVSSRPGKKPHVEKEAVLQCDSQKLIGGVILTVPVIILSTFFMNCLSGENILLLLLATPAWLWIGRHFHRNALSASRGYRLQRLCPGGAATGEGSNSLGRSTDSPGATMSHPKFSRSP